MKREDISRAVGDIDTAYIEEAAEEPHHSRRPWVKWALPLAACFLLICAAVLPTGVPADGAPPPNGGTPVSGEADGAPPSNGGTAVSGEADSAAKIETDEEIVPECDTDQREAVCRQLRFNDARLLAVSGDINLSAEDFVPMSRAELLAYFGTALPVSQALPSLRPLSPEPADYGLYRSSGGEIYRDGNAFPFVSGDGSQRVDILLSKASHYVCVTPEPTEDEALHFTAVNGRDLAVFRDGGTLYVEWMQSGVGWRVQAQGLSDEDFVQLLTVLVKPVEHVPEQTLTGRIQTLDPYAHALWVAAEDGSGGVRVELPADTQMDTLQLGDRVTVTWTGECATLQTVWAEQLVDLS